MTIEVLFQEVCGLYGDSQNPSYLQATLPDAKIIYTELPDTPYFVDNDPDIIYIGTMTEITQRRVIEKLRPYKTRIEALIDKGTVILATGNAGEIFTRHIEYITEETEIEGLGIFDMTVKNDLFNRFNSKVLGELEGITIVGFRSQFSIIYGDNSKNYFIKCTRGKGINKGTDLEGMRKNNLICTHMIGPVLVLNPDFCEYLIRLTGNEAVAAHREAAMDAKLQRIKEFSDPTVAF